MTSAASSAATAGMPVERDSPAPLLAVRDLAVTYEGSNAAATRGASFEIGPGEVVLLLGPSGSGKSTVALTTNGLIPQSIPATVEGSVLVSGDDATTTPIPRLSTRVGMVFQDPDAQLVTGTLLDEVAFGPENLRLPVDEVLSRAERALRRMGLWERRHENPDRLSGGGRQRLAIACALAMDSPLLVLDEPTANLDPEGIEDVYAALGEIARAGDRAILLVEHNLDAAIRFTDRVVALDHDGRTIADGPIDVVLRERAAELHDVGVWLPVATIAALRLRDAGYVLDPLPLTPDELRAGLAGADEVSTRSARSTPGGEGDATPPEVERGRAAPETKPATDEVSTRSARSTPGEDDAVSTRSARSTPGGEGDATPPEVERGRAAPETKPGAAAVSVRGLTLRRGRSTVLHDVDLTVRSGEFVAIVGANGAGKTSLVQAIAGVVRTPRGRIDVGGLDPARADARALARRIGFVFQNPEHQFVAHTVFDELAHGLRRQQLAADEIRERVDGMLRRFGLEQHAARHPFLLSGGQKRRLSVGTALIAGAPVLALDEPTFGQDRARADELLHLLRELNTAGTTVLVVTHDMQLVSEYAERCVVVGDGRVVADGAAADILGDDALLRSAALRMPPLRRALQGLDGLPELSGVTRLADLPRGAR